MSEYIYILSNPSMPNLIKVGKTTKHPSKRMSELHSTGVPTPFELEFSAMVDNCGFSELAAHRALANYRVTGKREFFRISVKKAIELILPVIGHYKIHDVKQSHGIEQICQELARRENERKKIELAQQIARQRENDRREAERLARRKPIEEKIFSYEQKLKQLGLRPIKKELSGFESFLFLCFFPLPFGWLIWLGAFSLFTGESLIFGWLSVGALIGGFFVYQKDKEIDEAFNKVNKPFKEIDENLNELRKELEKIY